MDYFYTLRIPYSVTNEEVRLAYIEQLKVTHPDRGGSVEDFKATNEAYEALKTALGREMHRCSLANSLANLAQRRFNTGEFEDALFHAISATEIDPANQTACLTLGRIYVALRQDEKAAEAYQKAGKHVEAKRFLHLMNKKKAEVPTETRSVSGFFRSLFRM